MEVTVTARHCSVSEDTRELVKDRTTETIGRLADRVSRAEVEFTQDVKSNSKESMRVEVTLRGKGPVVRAAGRAEDKMAAFDQALEKLHIQLRKAADRRKAHRGLRLSDLPAVLPTVTPDAAPADADDSGPQTVTIAGVEVTGDGPLVVREKEFVAPPLTLAQALDEMELVGHDFFLFNDAISGLPSVVYRRKAYDYGVIRLKAEEA